MAKKNEVSVKVEGGNLAVLDEAYGEAAVDLDEEDRRLLQAALHSAARLIRAHADHDFGVFEVKASPDELSVKKLDK